MELSTVAPTRPAFETKLGYGEEQRSELESLRNEAMERLREKGYIREEGPFVVCDVDKIKSGLNSEVVRSLGGIYSDKRFGDGKVAKTLFFIFADREVVSNEDYKLILNGDKEIKSKQLIYFPRNKEDALDPKTIREQDFYFGLWEMRKPTIVEYPTVEDGVNSGVSIWDVSVAALILHPKYGDSVDQDTEGNPIVRYPDGSRRRITSDFFRDWSYTGAPNKKDGVNIWSPKRFIANRCEDLIARGIVNPENFSSQEGYQTAKEFQIGGRKPTEKGLVMVGRERFSLGKEFGGKNSQVFKISRTEAAVVQKVGDVYEIVKVFSLAPIDENKVRMWTSGGHQYKYIGRDNVDFYLPEEFTRLNPENGVLVERFNKFLRFSSEVSKKTGINISEFSIKEQAMAVLIYDGYRDKEEFWKFLKDYKKPWLRTLMVVENLIKDSAGFFELSRHEHTGSCSASLEKLLSWYQDMKKT